MSKTKLRILTCVQGRHESLKAFFWQLDSLRKATGYELPVTLAYSDEEDLAFMEEQEFLTENCQAVQAPNQPLSEKHNEALRAAMTITGKSKWTHLIHLGSDDLISLDYLTHLALDPHDLAGINNAIFLNPNQRKAVYFEYKRNLLIGAGRMISREVLEQTKAELYEYRRPYYGYRRGDQEFIPPVVAEELLKRSVIFRVGRKKKYTLWVGKINKGLDNASHQVLFKLADPVNLSDQFEYPQLIDIKTEDNITSWDRVKDGDVLSARDMKKILKQIAPDVELL